MSTLRRELPTAVYAAPAMAFGSARVCSMAVGDNLSNALNNLKLDDSSQKSFMVPRSKANQHRQRRQLLNGAASTNPNNANIHHSIKKIISRISNIELSGPVHANTPKRAAATLPSTTLHPYSRPARSTARRIQESRGLNLEKPVRLHFCFLFFHSTNKSTAGGTRCSSWRTGSSWPTKSMPSHRRINPRLDTIQIDLAPDRSRRRHARAPESSTDPRSFVAGQASERVDCYREIFSSHTGYRAKAKNPRAYDD